MRTKLFSVAGFAMLVGMTMVSCQSKDLYDESTIQENEAHNRVAKYEDAFTRTFGQVASNHRWGFDQTTGAQTRTAVTSTHDYWIIPENFLGGSENKEGWNANALAGILTSLYEQKDVAGSGVTSSLSGFDFSNYFLQHVEKVQGGNIKNSIKGLQAYNSDTKEWEYVTNFVRGDNPDGEFTVSAEGTYFYAPINSSAKGTTLMTEMGGAADSEGHLFRIVYDEAFRCFLLSVTSQTSKKTNGRMADCDSIPPRCRLFVANRCRCRNNLNQKSAIFLRIPENRLTFAFAKTKKYKHLN